MGNNGERSSSHPAGTSERTREELQRWKSQLDQGLIEQSDLHAVLSLTLGQVIENGKIGEDNREQIAVIKGQLDTVIAKTEASSRFVERIDGELTPAVKELKTELGEVKNLLTSVAQHFGVPPKPSVSKEG